MDGWWVPLVINQEVHGDHKNHKEQEKSVRPAATSGAENTMETDDVEKPDSNSHTEPTIDNGNGMEKQDSKPPAAPTNDNGIGEEKSSSVEGKQSQSSSSSSSIDHLRVNLAEYARKEYLDTEVKRLTSHIDRVINDVYSFASITTTIKLIFQDYDQAPLLDADVNMHIYRLPGLVKLEGTIRFLRYTNTMQYFIRNVNFKELFPGLVLHGSSSGKNWKVIPLSVANNCIELHEAWSFDKNDKIAFDSLHLLREAPQIDTSCMQ